MLIPPLIWALNIGKRLVPFAHLVSDECRATWQYRSAVQLYLELLRQTQFLNSTEIESLQQKRLEYVFSAAGQSSWWRTQFAQAGIDPRRASLAELRKLPVQQKKVLTALPVAAFIATRNQSVLLWRSTTGVSGIPITWAQDVRSHFIEYAAYYLRALEYFSFPVRSNLHRRFFVMFNYPNVENYYLSRFARGVWLPYPTLASDHFPPREQRMAAYVALSQTRPWVLYGAPSALWYLAQVIEEDGANVTPNLVITSGEMLTGTLRVYLRTVFGSDVYSFYGTRELGTIGFSCLTGHNVFHLNSEHILLEVLDALGKECAIGIYGDLVMTSLTNTAMPLLRYKAGDVGRFVVDPCTCGISLPRFELIGRESEFFVLPGGAKSTIWPMYAAIFSGGRLNKILQYQIQQISENKIRILIIPKLTWTKADYQNLVRAVKNEAGEKFKVEVMLVNFIEKRRRKAKTFLSL